MADDDIERDDEGTDLISRTHVRALEEKAKKADELEARLAAMERETAFAKALGSSLSEAQLRYLAKGYEGELTTDAIRAEALALGLVADPDREPGPDQTERIFNASNGAAPPAPLDWQAEMAEAEKIPNRQAREDAILSVVERHGGITTRQSQ